MDLQQQLKNERIRYSYMIKRGSINPNIKQFYRKVANCHKSILFR